ncbi:MAG TPA: hypothetical protein VMB03_08275 [Bryobacteraceae bacterium]|nr:hypothetical protein [Bryobacteraceae bacterium]
MSKWFWIAPFALAAAGWGQTNAPIPTVIPETPLGGHVIPSGTELHVRINEALSTDRNEPGDAFTAALVAPVMVNGTVVLPVGTQFAGHVLANHEAGILKGRAKLVLGLESFQLAGHTFHVDLTAATYETGHKHKRLEEPDPNARAVVATRVAVTIPAETVVQFTLGSPVRV